MKPASSPLITLLASSNEIVMVDTVTFTLSDGSTLVYTVGEPPDTLAVSANEPQGNTP